MNRLQMINYLGLINYEQTKPYQFLKLIQETMQNMGEMRVQGITSKHGFTKGRISRLEFPDQNKYYDIQMKSGKIRPIIFGSPDVRLVVPEFCTIKHLRGGKKRYVTYTLRGQVSSDEVRIYTPRMAWDVGDVYSPPLSEGAEAMHGQTNEALQAIMLLSEVMEAVPLDRLMALVGPCVHDPPEGYEG